VCNSHVRWAVGDPVTVIPNFVLAFIEDAYPMILLLLYKSFPP